MSVTASESPRLRLGDVRVDLKKLFLKLGEAAARLGLAKATGDWKSAGGALITAVFGAVDAVSVQRPAEALAWELIRNGLTRALGELVLESFPGLEPAPADHRIIEKKIDNAVGETAIQIDQNFFRNPGALPLLPVVEELFAAWLEQLYELPPPTSIALSRRLRSYFAVALHAEWEARRDHYKEVLSVLTGPFASAARWEQEWDRYHLSLVKQFDQPVFEEYFALSEVYVALRAVWEKTLQSASDKSAGRLGSRLGIGEERAALSVVVDSEEAIRTWLTARKPADSIRVIRGGPGSGKSTLAKKLAADLATPPSNTRVL